MHRKGVRRHAPPHLENRHKQKKKTKMATAACTESGTKKEKGTEHLSKRRRHEDVMPTHTHRCALFLVHVYEGAKAATGGGRCIFEGRGGAQTAHACLEQARQAPRMYMSDSTLPRLPPHLIRALRVRAAGHAIRTQQHHTLMGGGKRIGSASVSRGTTQASRAIGAGSAGVRGAEREEVDAACFPLHVHASLFTRLSPYQSHSGPSRSPGPRWCVQTVGEGIEKSRIKAKL